MKFHSSYFLPRGLAAIFLATGSAFAAEYYIGTTGENAGGSSFTNPLTPSAAGWKLNNAGTAVAPLAGNNYTVGGPNIGGNAVGTLLRSPTSGSVTFAGDKLTISSGARFIGKSNNNTGGVGTTLTINNLVLNGGLFDQADANNGAILTIAGNINVTATTSLGALSNETLSITSTITGSSNLVIDGTANGNADTGLVRFTGTSSAYTGSITITSSTATVPVAPTLQIGNNGTTGSFSGSTNIINNGALRFNRTNTITQGTDFGLISGTGSVTQTGTGNVILNAANTFTGQVSIFTGGSITASSLNSVIGGTASSSLGAPTTVEKGTIVLGGNGAAGTLIYNGGGETTDRAISLRAFSAGSNGVIDQSGTTGLLKFTGGITNTSGAAHVITLQGSTGGTGEISGAITDGAGLALTKAGTGTWTLSNGGSTFTGNILVSNGTLKAATTNVNSSNPTAGILGNTTVARSITVSSGATLEFAIGNVLATGAYNPANVTLNLNGGTLRSTAGDTNTLGVVNLNGGTITATTGTANASYQSYVLNQTVTATGTTQSVISTTAGGNNGYHLGVGTNKTVTFDVDPGATGASLLVSAPLIGGSGTAGGAAGSGIIKTGGGTMTLSGANTYTGKTTISGGSLALASTASIANSSEISINGGNFNVSAVSGFSLGSGQSLTGSGGSVTGAITVNGTLAIGNSPGTMTFNNDLTFGSGAVSNFEFTNIALGINSFDLAQGGVGTQAVTFGGTLNLLFSGGTYANGGSVQIFNFDTYGGTFSTVNFSGLDVGQSAVFDTATGYVTVVPEPSAALLGGLGMVILLRRRRA
ncbi:MAG: autotransporter-associated beta strand repeat-containing protein [Luteolibacter sp.]|uniref:beta strand repeat-containing protein n=1 Tax=Luteolibacter sp. TaxID=1962973 RepID=UPI003263E920